MNDQLEQKKNDRTLFGFWIYLMTDLMMFAVLFASYAVLRHNTFGSVSIDQIENLPFVLIETLVLLTSSFTAGLGTIAVTKHDKDKTLLWFGITFLLGLSFLIMEITEFSHLIAEGHTYQTSAFLSSFFTLLGTHGLHIAVGLLWLIILITQILHDGLRENVVSKFERLGMFWHFLDIVWIFIFTFVYLIGGIK